MGNSSYFNFLERLFVNCKEEKESQTPRDWQQSCADERRRAWTDLQGGLRPSRGSTPSPAEGQTRQHEVSTHTWCLCVHFLSQQSAAQIKTAVAGVRRTSTSVKVPQCRKTLLQVKVVSFLFQFSSDLQTHSDQIRFCCETQALTFILMVKVCSGWKISWLADQSEQSRAALPRWSV